MSWTLLESLDSDGMAAAAWCRVSKNEETAMPREFTNKLIHNAENYLVEWESIARECLTRMSEDEVKEMALDMDWVEECEFCDDEVE